MSFNRWRVINPHSAFLLIARLCDVSHCLYNQSKREEFQLFHGYNQIPSTCYLQSMQMNNHFGLSWTNACVGVCIACNKIIWCLELEGILKIILLQPLPWRGNLSLGLLVEGFIKPGLDHLQGWSVHKFSEQPVPLSHHLQSKTFLPNICSKPALFQFNATSPYPVTTCPCIKSLFMFLVGILQVLEGHI